jgi:uncharacterized membrane protein
MKFEIRHRFTGNILFSLEFVLQIKLERRNIRWRTVMDLGEQSKKRSICVS